MISYIAGEKSICFSFISDVNLDQLEKEVDVVAAKKSYELFHKNNPEGINQVVYPNTYASVVAQAKNRKIICPMRYRLRPSRSSEEIPLKYNMYNAKIECLTSKDSWKHLISRNHGVVAMNGFNEWISTEKGKKIVRFSLTEQKLFWVAALFDIWIDPKTSEKLISFAIITKAAPAYIQNIGHNRCPAILKKQNINTWLDTSALSQAQSIKLLEGHDDYSFEHEFTEF